MTTSIATIKRSTRSESDRRVLTLAATLGDRILRWSARYYDAGIGEALEALPPSRRAEAALRWHDRQGRVL